MDSVSTDFPEVKCKGCPAKVVQADTQVGTTTAVERVPFKKGNVGLTLSLFGGRPLVVVRQGPTRWKIHECDARAFSADNFTRKVKP